MTDRSRRAFLAAMGGVSLGPLARPSQGSPSTTWRSEFPALAQHIAGVPLAYLDNAATTQRPREVIEALVRFCERDNANPSSSMHTLARRAAEAQEAARTTVAQFLKASSPEEIIFTRGTTEAINLVAATWGTAELRAGDEIVVTIAEHASNLFPWQRLAKQVGALLKVVDVFDDGRLRLDHLEDVISPRTRLVAVTHVSNVLGIVYPVAEICAIARRRDAAVLVDAAQSAPHVRLDVQQLGCDFLAFSSHKLLGPMGVGVLWVRAAQLKGMPAYHVGSNMAHGMSIDSAVAEPGALRFQAGTPNVSGPVGLAQALRFLQRVGFESLRVQDDILTTRALTRLQTVPGLRLFGTAGPSPLARDSASFGVAGPAERIPVFTFTLAGVTVPEIVAAADCAGIAIRGGDLAALPLLRRFGVNVAARASAYFYNTPEEIDRLVEVLVRLSKRTGNF